MTARNQDSIAGFSLCDRIIISSMSSNLFVDYLSTYSDKKLEFSSRLVEG
ncbi:hypothetical protein AM1_4851 [Acaryochloris marina MBIC11017]|uniref:Uncharacterized protein n=1 Tax=Acaryochloris marina (strain MBIC 11017) TaxID=329726 RepID=B0C3I8_ACAM1|nr:hypothetical protein AM1_4851 [Acaryochloris marina MBIC11017]